MSDATDQSQPVLSARSLVVLVGASGSGKSTWAAHVARPEQIVSSDALRGIVGEGPHDQRAGGDAFEVLEAIVAARLRRRLFTVVDTLGLDVDRRAAWVAAAHAADMEAVAVVHDTPAKTCRARNKLRSRPVPAKVLTSQLERVDGIAETLAGEGFDAVLRAEDVADVRVVVPEVAAARAATRPARPPAPTADAASPAATFGADRAGTHLQFGLHVSRFDGDAAALGARLRDVAVAAERAGFTHLAAMDHVLQIPQVGRVWEHMLEGWTTLAHCAAVTERLRVGTLVSGVTYRNPALLGKMAATLDVLSGGRSFLGVGAAWFEQEHRAYGWDFPRAGERLDLLEDTLELLPMLWGKGQPAYEGRRVSVPSATCYPRPVQDPIPILVGGQGEQRTLRLAAQHADACNLFGAPETVAGKLEVLHRHCEAVQREPSEVAVTTLGPVLVGADDGDLDALLAELGRPDVSRETNLQTLSAGTVEDQVARFGAYRDLGVGTAFVHLPRLDVELVERCADLVAAFA